MPPGAIGIGCAGSIDVKHGIVRNSPNFHQWNQVPLKEWIEQDTGLFVTVHNDANCAAVTEHQLGNGVGYDHMILVTLGTGIGGGIIADGRLLLGNTGTAGEIGHFSIDPNGPSCKCE